MSYKLTFGLVFSVSFAVYCTMLVWTLPGIAAGANGLAPFDMRPFGYTQAEAHAFLSALSREARGLYLGPQRLLDTFYPALLAATTCLAFRGVSSGYVGLAGMLLALAGAAADYVENAAVLKMLVAADLPSAEMVAQASRWTQIKSASSAAALTLLLLLAAVYLFRVRVLRRGREKDALRARVQQRRATTPVTRNDSGA